jgi:hypothetical protein
MDVFHTTAVFRYRKTNKIMRAPDPRETLKTCAGVAVGKCCDDKKYGYDQLQ